MANKRQNNPFGLPSISDCFGKISNGKSKNNNPLGLPPRPFVFGGVKNLMTEITLEHSQRHKEMQ